MLKFKFAITIYLKMNINERINFKAYWITYEKNSFINRVLTESIFSSDSYYKTSPYPMAWQFQS